jgi:hypothetical protein
MCKTQVIEYATGVAALDSRTELTQRDIDFSLAALGMCIREELNDRKDKAIAIDPA